MGASDVGVSACQNFGVGYDMGLAVARVKVEPIDDGKSRLSIYDGRDFAVLGDVRGDNGEKLRRTLIDALRDAILCEWAAGGQRRCRT